MLVNLLEMGFCILMSANTSETECIIITYLIVNTGHLTTLLKIVFTAKAIL